MENFYHVIRTEWAGIFVTGKENVVISGDHELDLKQLTIAVFI